MALRWIRLAVVLSGALLVTGCGPGPTTAGGWATKMSPPPKGLTLAPPPPADVYWVSIASAKLPPRTDGGQLWDEVGGWPDPVVVLLIDGEEVMKTDAAEDTITPTWNAPHANLHIPDGSSFAADVSDQDALQSLPIGKASGGPPTAADLTEGRMVFDLGRSAELVVKVEAAHGLLGLGFDYEVLGDKAIVRKVMKFSPAGRAGLVAGDQIVAIADRSLVDAKPREIRSSVNSIGTKPARVTVKHRAGTTETFEIGVGAIYPLYAEYGEID